MKDTEFKNYYTMAGRGLPSRIPGKNRLPSSCHPASQYDEVKAACECQAFREVRALVLNDWTTGCFRQGCEKCLTHGWGCIHYFPWPTRRGSWFKRV
ncbi:MAG: hypothetical protein KKG09_06455 [Verrucomicrobia bacterium]|nr:hypothetical protein [Verrucomicrobiota bacterium]MCG2679729.1 hypothetical protein [Kiritimatiellia bacterium]MBU4247563.1 hypothetical protein [Verrucomicrobiota bacterium]MBU4290717.1 hypothetical protein [Verrucomicrobiota bacterium]MBU4428801.1 hypothetical protein [Verrucomicrobiota bacterium]